jgi:pterin-4a-carbinolamine dehydratase/glutaredoxin
MDVTLYTRRDCSLCDRAKETLRQAGVTPKEIDVDADPDLKARFTNDVPVIFIDGVEAFRHRVPVDGIRAFAAGWKIVEAHHLEKQFKFADFAQALAFANRIGVIAEEMSHHPDLLVRWGEVRVMTWSHDKNAITSRDYALAGRIDSLR